MGNDFNLIQPLDGLQNMSGLAPTQRRKERKQQPYKQKKQSQHENDSNDNIEDDGHIIDYSA